MLLSLSLSTPFVPLSLTLLFVFLCLSQLVPLSQFPLSLCLSYLVSLLAPLSICPSAFYFFLPSLSVPFCPFLSLYVPLCPFMSLSVPFCPFLSLSVPFCLFISIFLFEWRTHLSLSPSPFYLYNNFQHFLAIIVTLD